MHTMVSRMTYIVQLNHVHVEIARAHGIPTCRSNKTICSIDTSFVAIHYIYHTLAMSRATHFKRG